MVLMGLLALASTSKPAGADCSDGSVKFSGTGPDGEDGKDEGDGGDGGSRVDGGEGLTGVEREILPSGAGTGAPPLLSPLPCPDLATSGAGPTAPPHLVKDACIQTRSNSGDPSVPQRQPR